MYYNVNMLKFSERLKELRLSKGMTQRQLAEKFKIHQTTVKDWEVKGKQPGYETLIALAQFFNVSVDYLLGVTDNK